MQVLMAFIECLTSIKAQCKLLSEREREKEREREGGKVEREVCGRERESCDSRFILAHFFFYYLLLLLLLLLLVLLLLFFARCRKIRL